MGSAGTPPPLSGGVADHLKQALSHVCLLPPSATRNQKNKNEATGPRNKFDDRRYLQPSWIQHTNVTDGQTDTGRQQRPRLHKASRSKICV